LNACFSLLVGGLENYELNWALWRTSIYKVSRLQHSVYIICLFMLSIQISHERSLKMSKIWSLASV
jgi:hypothetical protein